MTCDLLIAVTAYPHAAIHRLFLILANLGGFGLLILSFLDSSPLFIPFGNDLMMLALTGQRHRLLVYYALMATAGSTSGTLIVDALSRKGGEEGLERAVPRRRLNYVKKRIKKNATWALALASLMPPPFPFTAFVAAAAAFQYPRKRLLLVVSLSRLSRFLIEGALGIFVGRSLLRLAGSATVAYLVGGLIVLSFAASGFAVFSWVKRGRFSSAR